MTLNSYRSWSLSDGGVNVFEIPKQYAAESVIEPKTFVAKDMKKPVKDRILQSLLSARLIWQIAGEGIPSLINAEYNCSVIMGLDIKLKAIKDSAFFAELVQHMLKAPCVVRFYDNAEEVYSFAHKRLSHTDAAQVVILERVETPPMSLVFTDKTAEKLKRYLAFDALLNKSDKLSLYLEATIKAFIISHPKLYSGIEELIDRKLWYNREEMLVLFERLIELVRLKGELKAEKLPGVKAKLNGEIKRVMEGLR